jgi:dinuclear metal center YbgI/SA1388 family protein
MALSLRDVVAHAEALWPASGAEEWDSVGVVVGSRDSTVTRVHFVVDVTEQTVREALESGCDLVIAHHPLLLRGVETVAEETYKGRLIAQLVRSNCALLTVHTNGDRVESGTSATLAAAIGIVDGQPVVPHESGGGMGIVGAVERQSLGSLAQRLAAVLPATAGGIKVSGDFDQIVESVALCAGAGDSLLSHRLVRESDVFVTSDLRHHPVSEFREQAQLEKKTAVIDIAHWAAEWLWLSVAAQELKRSCPGLSISVSDINTDPWNFVVVQ